VRPTIAELITGFLEQAVGSRARAMFRLTAKSVADLKLCLEDLELALPPKQQRRLLVELAPGYNYTWLRFNNL